MGENYRAIKGHNSGDFFPGTELTESKKNKDKSDFFANESSPVLSKSGQNGSPPTIGNYRAFVAFWLWGQTIGELAAISQATLQW